MGVPRRVCDAVAKSSSAGRPLALVSRPPSCALQAPAKTSLVLQALAVLLPTLPLRQRYPKPTISVSPSEVVALGGHVTVHCKSQGYAGMEFSLCKEGSASVDCRSTKVAAVEEVAFSIVDAQQSDGGTYRCIYHSKSDEGPCNPVELILRGEELTLEPSGQPALSMNVTIECQGPEKGLHFILLKSRERKASQWAEEDRSTAEFPLSLMSPEDAGTYACQYHRKGKRFLLSEPSDPVELRLRGERLALLSSHQPRPPERGVQPVWSYLWVPLQGATSQNRRVVES
uniref:Ig-like domain-containing protein n=1 Tax=Varanus komodoensis TaxID=61221 RepID=A0A8D2LL46_VARKO